MIDYSKIGSVMLAASMALTQSVCVQGKCTG